MPDLVYDIRQSPTKDRLDIYKIRAQLARTGILFQTHIDSLSKAVVWSDMRILHCQDGDQGSRSFPKPYHCSCLNLLDPQLAVLAMPWDLRHSQSGL